MQKISTIHNISEPNSIIKRIIHHDRVGFITGMKDSISQDNVIHHINKIKDKDHTINSIDAENTFDKMQH